MARNSLVPWKKQEDEYRDDIDSDFSGLHSPRLTDTMNTPVFIRNDKPQADAMKAMKMRWWK